MAGIFGAITLDDGDRTFLSTIGQDVVYDESQKYLTRYNAELSAAMAVFVERETEDYKLRYKLPGGGRMQQRGAYGRPGAVKATGQWDVAFPLFDFGEQVAENDVAYAYMTVAEYQRHVDTVMIRNTNTLSFEILRALFNNTERPFVDPLWGTLNVEPLANNDGVVYPPVLGSEVEAQDNHYLASGYAANTISNANNPYPVLVNELTEHFGASTGGDNIATFIHPDEVPETEDLGDFDAVNDRFTTPGANADQLFGLPDVPGRIVGRTNSTWVIEWRKIPSGYMLALQLDAPKPLIVRRDPANTGLPQGLTLVARREEFPMEGAFWRNRYGIGVGNRLNGVVMQLTAGGYAIPAAFA